MGQYYYVCNLDKREYIHPLRFGDGLKLLEFGCGGNTMTALAVLLADGNGRGGGDLRSDNPIVGSWAGDRIVIAGDYADIGKFLQSLRGRHEQVLAAMRGDSEAINLHDFASENFQDISDAVAQALLDDRYVRGDLTRAVAARSDSQSLAPSLRALWPAKETKKPKAKEDDSC